MSLFIGRLDSDAQREDLVKFFSPYGQVIRCDVKRGYGFVEFVDKHDAEEAKRECDGKTLLNSSIAIEWARGETRRSRTNECFKCGKEGHWARECSSGGGDNDRGGSFRRRDDGRGRSRSPEPRGFSSRYSSRSPQGSRSSGAFASSRYDRSPSPRRFGSRGGRSPSPRRFGGRGDRSPSPRRFGGRGDRSPSPRRFGGRGDRSPSPRRFGGRGDRSPRRFDAPPPPPSSDSSVYSSRPSYEPLPIPSGLPPLAAPSATNEPSVW